MKKEYTKEDLLFLLMEYFERKFKLEENSSVMIFYNKDFYFNCVDKKSMLSIAKININEILRACNNVASEDNLFEDAEDLLDELNSLTKFNNIVYYIIKYLEEKYQIMCISDES